MRKPRHKEAKQLVPGHLAMSDRSNIQTPIPAFAVRALTSCAVRSPVLQSGGQLYNDGGTHLIAKENKIESCGNLLKITQQVKGKSKWRMRERDFWSVGSFPRHLTACFSGSGSQRQMASGILSSMHVLPNESSQKSQGPERMQAPHTPPTNMPIQLKLVLLKEVCHFMSRHITFMQSHLSLLEKQGNLFILAAFPFLLKTSPLMT